MEQSLKGYFELISGVNKKGEAMTDALKMDLIDILEALYKHSYTPEQALEKIQCRLKQELTNSQEKGNKSEEEQQITVKLAPKKSFPVPLKISKEAEFIKGVLQEEDELEEGEGNGRE